MPAFDVKTLYNNVTHLAKIGGRKLGDLEEKAGVSAGYLSRLVKSTAPTKVPVGLVVSLADQLGVSLDLLVRHDLTALTMTEQCVAFFLEKLVSETKGGVICWNRFSGDTVLQDTEVYDDGTTSNPLVAYRGGKFVYLSAFGPKDGCCPVGEFFAADINNGNTRAFLFQVKHPEADGTDFELYIRQNVMVELPFNNPEPVCGTDPRFPSPLDCFLIRLYEAVSLGTRNIHFSPTVQTVISQYLGIKNPDANA